jgi:ABC-2 type transport system ATP-binding protein
VDTIVELDNVTRRFGDVVAVQDVSLALRAGEILGLYGPSGSGKTTTMRLILGVLLPTSGTVRVFGRKSTHVGGKERRQIGYGPQRFIYPPTLAADEVLWFAAGLYGMGWLHTNHQVHYVLDRVDLWPKRKRIVNDMSGGERRRVTNAAALVHQPRLVFMDEPTSGLDPILRDRTWTWFRELRDKGTTLLVTGHYLDEAEECDRVALIVDGRVTSVGTPQELRRQAFGGEVVEVKVDGSLAEATDAVRGVPGVRRVRVAGEGDLWVTVEEAGRAVPSIIQGLQGRGLTVSSANEIRPPFDQVYERLVERVSV